MGSVLLSAVPLPLLLLQQTPLPKPLLKPPLKPPLEPLKTILKPLLMRPHLILKTQLIAPLKDPLKAPLKDPLKAPLKDPLKAQLKDPLKAQLKAPLKAPLKPPQMPQLRRTSALHVTNQPAVKEEMTVELALLLCPFLPSSYPQSLPAC